MDKKPKKKKKIEAKRFVIDKNEYHFYNKGKRIGNLKFTEEPDRFGIRFDWAEDTEEEPED